MIIAAVAWSDVAGIWSSTWPYLTFPAGFAAKAVFDHLVDYRSNKAIEGYKAELRKTEVAFDRKSKSQDDEIAALRRTALDGFAVASAAVTQRKLEAVDRLWAAVIDLNRYQIVSKMMSPIKVDVAIEAASQQTPDGLRARQFAEMLWRACGLDDMKPPPSPPDNERPFLTETAWARFSLYRSAMTLPIFHLASMKGGMPHGWLKSPPPLLEAVKTAMLHYSQLIDDYGVSAVPELLDEIRDMVLDEIRAIIAGTSTDYDLEKAAKIISATRSVDDLNTRPLEVPPDLAR
ncbi:MAG TPA: hypothetical protein VK804_25065 [Bradyrhizobium sp.]|jgi:hypothetical protein|uniref:hypothetical protein n=1 Tax=Bradyrhizobium sp. TaxID=376 RepID=UPI002C6059B6|nr:hypothetical protein [Bradyrhizobium sp.]HTB03755.1 hypothetical protein [Bradyrhizobium sp.]